MEQLWKFAEWILPIFILNTLPCSDCVVMQPAWPALEFRELLSLIFTLLLLTVSDVQSTFYWLLQPRSPC